jgi:hypothetical protein
MTTPKKKMTRKQEYDHYAKTENQRPQGPARRRKQNLTEMVPVRFEADVLDDRINEVREIGSYVSAWVARTTWH